MTSNAFSELTKKTRRLRQGPNPAYEQHIEAQVMPLFATIVTLPRPIDPSRVPYHNQVYARAYVANNKICDFTAIVQFAKEPKSDRFLKTRQHRALTNACFCARFPILETGIRERRRRERENLGRNSLFYDLKFTILRLWRG